MKKIFLFLMFSALFLFTYSNSFGNCVPPQGDFDLAFQLDDCLTGTKLVSAETKIGGGFDTTIKKWTTNISLFLGIAAVLGIVYGAFTMTISAGEDEKVNKAKGIIKWSIIGFIGLITASFLINLVVRLFYSLS